MDTCRCPRKLTGREEYNKIIEFQEEDRYHRLLCPTETRFCYSLLLHMIKGAIFLRPKQQLFITLLVILGHFLTIYQCQLVHLIFQ